MIVRELVEGTAAVTISDQLKVEHNVFVSAQTSIALRNIATISVVPIVKPPLHTIPLAILGAVATIYFYGQMPAPQWNGQADYRSTVLWVGGLLTLGLIVARFRKRAPEWRLLIGANDGSLNYFTSPEKEILDKIRALLTERLEKRDTASVYNINFQTGQVQVVEGGAVVSNAVVGSSNSVASDASRIGTTEVSNSPGAQVGDGNTSSGNTISAIDYAPVLPDVRRMRDEFAGRPEYDYIVQRLNKLEELMVSGTRSDADKGQLRSLLMDLSHIFNAIPNAMTLFREVARIAGMPV